jgi:hypothetical protein
MHYAASASLSAEPGFIVPSGAWGSLRIAIRSDDRDRCHHAVVHEAQASRDALVHERQASRAAFWRAFAAALGAHSLPLVAANGLAGGTLGQGIGRALGAGIIFALWAMIAPRGAAFVLLAILVLGMLADIVGLVAFHSDLGPVVVIAFAFAVIPFNVIAIVWARRARPRARSYRDARRRLRHYKRDDRIRAGGGM